AAPGITIRPGKLFGRGDDDEPEETLPPVALDDPMEPLDLFARASGGEVVTTDRALRDALARLGARIEIAYPSRLPYEAGTARIEVLTTRPGLTVRAPRYAARGLPPALADLRLGRVLGGRDDEGDLSLAAVLEVGAGGETGTASDLTTPASLETRLDLHDLEGQGGLDSVDLRLTVAATGAAGERRLLQEVLRDQNLGQGQEWRLRRNVDLPADATAVAVVIEELDGGRWGGRRAAVVRTSGVEAGFLPDPKALALQVPDETLLRGRTRFEVEVYDSAIARVDFLLDDRTVDSRREPPFAARIDLGRTPRRMLLTAVAYNSAGAELGRDSTVLNGGDVGLGVRIVQPTKPQGTGPVDVEAEISVPIERSLDRVLFFWNNEQVATLFSPPFRQRVMIPEDRPVGYVRVVAMLDDGALAEDVVFMNGPDAGERVDVQLVELYVVVTDRDGRPVRGLGPEEFSVREEGVPQNIATFSDAAELPLTLGMAIDSSASMFVKLPRVQRAALRFLQSTFKEQDRAFVVDFDSKPRLVRGTTNDLGRLERSINGLEASGRTALWESVVFSLVQLQGVRGRKALVVFSDGADEDDQFPFRSSLRIAREMGVPIYMILMKKEPQESAARGLLSRSFTSRAQRLAAATGGRVFYAKEYDSLDEVYDEIELELRSQYLLAYYPEGRSEEGGWREVDVDLARRDLKPRTLRGYWQ
ncbi:MAG: VWA domain-containing protein, partial [Acidobacteriota bacterium]